MVTVHSNFSLSSPSKFEGKLNLPRRSYRLGQQSRDRVGAPVELKMSVVGLSPDPDGEAKLGRFKILKTSTRNCALKFSEIRLMKLFLNSEKSRFVRPGPTMMLRPALPRRLKHCGKVPSLGSQP